MKLKKNPIFKTDVENINEIVESVQDVGEQANTTIKN